MRIAILSDIHANSYALKEVLVLAEELEIEQLIIAGDTVGYYYGIQEVLTNLKRFKIEIVRGNHEEMLFRFEAGALNREKHNEIYGSAISSTLKKLSTSEVAILREAIHPKSVMFDSVKFLISHGSPWDMNLYLYEDQIDNYWKNFAEYEEEVFILGHTHRQLFFEKDGKIIINPGSVGQSRSNPGYAEWAVFDTSNLEVKFQSTPYEYSKILSDCHKNDPGVSLLTKSFIKIGL